MGRSGAPMPYPTFTGAPESLCPPEAQLLAAAVIEVPAAFYLPPPCVTGREKEGRVFRAPSSAKGQQPGTPARAEG